MARAAHGWPLLGVVAVVGSGCGGTFDRAEAAVRTPSDPTPLAKCHVAASSANPLVTEWPASEKARLQSLTASQVVAVAYSGCEMRIVAGCRIPGTYRWQQTTPATDSVEIDDADQLYAKLPLGAVSLEAELQRSGHFSIRTTVSGQLKLGEIDTSQVPRDGDCGAVTHIVSALSVGAFKLVTGGATHAKAGAGFMGVEGGGAIAREEQVLREAGDPSKCAESTADSPPALCTSPVQVFLEPVRRAPTEAETRANQEEERARAANGIQMSLGAPPDDTTPWALKTANGSLLCTLPCARWVTPQNGYYVERQSELKADVVRIALPQAWDYTGGQKVDMKVEPARGDFGWPLVTGLGSIVVMSVGLASVFEKHLCSYDSGAYTSSDGPCPQSASDATHATGSLDSDTGGDHRVLGWGLVGAGVLGLGASVYWFLWSHFPRVSGTLQEGAPRAGQGGVWVSVTPAGLVGRF